MLLFTPGPTPVPESIRNAMAGETIHHRTPEFEAIFARARAALLRLMGTEEALMLAATGTGAMEAAVSNLCSNTLLNVNAGKFGERFGKIARANGLDNIELKYEWNTPATVDDVLDALQEHPRIDAIAVQISESAGGLRHPVEAIAAAVKEVRPDVMIIADGITAVGVEPIDVTDIDALIAGSQKALMLPPGLAALGLSAAALEKIGSGKGYYFNLATEIKKQRTNTTAWTAATTLVIGLEAILAAFEAKGYDALFDETARRGEATRTALEAIGLHVYPAMPAPSMTTIDDVQASEIRTMMKDEFEVNMAGGQDHLKGKIFRINHMGLISAYEAAWVVNAIEVTLAKLGRRDYNGTAGRRFSEIYYGLGV